MSGLSRDRLYIDSKYLEGFNLFIGDSAKFKIDKFSQITNWAKLKSKQHHSTVLLNSFPMNGHTLGFCP